MSFVQHHFEDMSVEKDPVLGEQITGNVLNLFILGIVVCMNRDLPTSRPFLAGGVPGVIYANAQQHETDLFSMLNKDLTS